MSQSLVMKPDISEQETPVQPAAVDRFWLWLLGSFLLALTPFAFAYLSEAGYFEESFGDLPFIVALVAPVLWLAIYTVAVTRYGLRALWLLIGAPVLCQPYYTWIYLAVVGCYLQGQCG
jgi:hypothetical protein